MKPSLIEQRTQGALVHAESFANRQPTHADLRAAFEAGWDGRHKARLYRIFIGVPCTQWLWQPFVQSLLYAFMPRELEVSFAFPHSHFLHMSRSDCIKGALDDPEVDFLLMVDSDQIFGLHTIPRLLSWNVPVVSPVIVQRNGPPTPVAYREVGKDENGYWRYEAQTDAIAAYVSQFRMEDWEGGHVANLPLVPYRETAVKNIPDEIKKGLGHPLMPVDATGLGMTLIRRDVLESLTPDSKGLYCFPGDTKVSAPTGVERAYRRWYEGELVEITTAAGHKLSGTPNHPVLTDRGWVKLGLLSEGDSVISRLGSKKLGLGDNHVENVDTTISEIFDLAARVGLVCRNSGTDNQFHGDGQDGDVDVVTMGGVLRDRVLPAFPQPLHQHRLSRTSLGEGALSRNRHLPVLVRVASSPIGGGILASQVGSHVHSVGPAGNIESLQQTINTRMVNAEPLGNAVRRLSPLVGGNNGIGIHFNKIVGERHRIGTPSLNGPASFQSVTNPPASVSNDASNGVSRNTEVSGDVLQSLSRFVAPDQIVSVRRIPFWAGHVYNLQTKDHWYAANSIIAHNCDSSSGGEDFSLMRNIRAAGWGGMNPGPRGGGIYYDRGCLIGHLGIVSKGMHDLVNYREEQEQIHLANEAKQNALPPAVPFLLNEMQGKPTPSWVHQRLPGEEVAV